MLIKKLIFYNKDNTPDRSQDDPMYERMRLAEALEKRATVLVNGVLLVKGVGKLSGLCLRDTALKDGTVLRAGLWYSPVDDRSRDAIREAFDRGDSRLEQPSGRWAVMRPLSDLEETIWYNLKRKKGATAEELLHEARSYTAHMPERFGTKIEGMS